MTMKNGKTLQHIAAVAVVLLALLVFAAPVSAEDVTATVSTNEEFKVNVTQDAETIVINLNADVVIYDTAAWDTNALGGDNTKTITINGNGHTLTFHQTNSDWSHVVTENESAVLILNNVNITNSGYNNGPWNRHDINFNCSVDMTDVFSDKALAFKNGAKLTNVTINDPNTSDTYAIWIQPNGQTVTINGLTIDMLGCSDGRGIKIDEQYVASPAKVTLSINDAIFKTEEKSAIIVKSVAGADITLSNVDISNVYEDSTNHVWVDKDAAEYASNVTVNGGSLFVEGSVAKIGTTFYKTLEEAVSAATDGQTVTVLKDVALTEKITIDDKDVTITAASPVTITTSVVDVFTVSTGGKLTLGQNITVNSATSILYVNGGSVIIDGAVLNSTGSQYAMIYADAGTLTVKDGVLETGAVNVIQAKGNGVTITINGGKLHSSGTSALAISESAIATISGGDVTSANDYASYSYNNGKIVVSENGVITTNSGSSALIAATSGIVDVTGGTINGGVLAHENAAAKATISGGTINGPVGVNDGASMTITGGTFSSNPSAFIASGYEVVQPGNSYLVQKYVDRSSSSSSSSTEEPEQPEEPVVEPETPAAPGEVTSSTEVTDGGDVTFETPAGEDGSAPAAADDEVKGVVLPTGTEGTVEFVPVSEQPAPAGQEENTKRVFEINVPSYKKGEASVIKFQMTLAEITADGKTAADVALWHFDEDTGEWTKLVTSFTIVDGIVYFEAITNDFSPFAIIYADEPAADLPTDTPETPETPEEPASPAPVLAVLAALGAAVVLRRK